MIIGDKKRAVSVILSKMKNDGSTSETSVAPESGDHDEYTSFAEDMLAAFKASSVQELAACLKAFHAMVNEEDEEQDQGE